MSSPSQPPFRRFLFPDETASVVPAAFAAAPVAASTLTKTAVDTERLWWESLSDQQPVALYQPQHYEPRYPYPLLVLFHERGRDERQWMAAMGTLSRRNYVAVGLRGPRRVRSTDEVPGYDWPAEMQEHDEAYAFAAIERAMRRCHVHSERIFLAGIGAGAATAFRLGLQFPDRFGGVVALSGSLATVRLPAGGRRGVRSLPVFLGHSPAGAVEAEETHRLLYAAGNDVHRVQYAVDQPLHQTPLRDLNRWLMDRIQGQ